MPTYSIYLPLEKSNAKISRILKHALIASNPLDFPREEQATVKELQAYYQQRKEKLDNKINLLVQKRKQLKSRKKHKEGL